MKNKYLLIFAQVHEEFRIPELLSIAELHNIDISIPENVDVSRPFMVLELDNDEQARILASRCILLKWICDFYAQGQTYVEVHGQTRANIFKYSQYIEDTSFKFIVSAHNHTIPQSKQREVVESFSYMGLLGKIEMKTPDIIFMCFEEYFDKHGKTREELEMTGKLREVFFGRLVAEGTARPLARKFDVKKRSYFGNTSMDAEVSLLMANQTLASSGKLIYDPFIGTGSLAYVSAHFGAFVYGSDIDGRQMRGKEKVPGIRRAAAQYEVADRIVDLSTFDITQNPWRCGDLFDAIITDPPYGVRAGAKRLGRKKPMKKGISERIGPNPRPDNQPHIPPTRPYELSELAVDLILLARHMLRPGGRLVFFLPTVTEDYTEVDVQSMLCDGMEIIANSLQDFGSWGRRLITVRKTSKESYPRPTFAPPVVPEDGPLLQDNHVPAHKDFREKYFRGFRRETEQQSS